MTMTFKPSPALAARMIEAGLDADLFKSPSVYMPPDIQDGECFLGLDDGFSAVQLRLIADYLDEYTRFIEHPLRG